MKKTNYSVLASIILFVSLLNSCTAYKDVPYLQNAESFISTKEGSKLYDATIMPKDLLTVIVNCEDPQLAVPFNFTAATSNSLAVTSSISTPTIQSYLVDNDGDIEFPILGKLHVAGHTKRSCEAMLKDKLKIYISDPWVTVRMANFRVTVIGEVNQPHTFTSPNEKLNIFEALAMSGDMTIYGTRNNVKLIRTSAEGEKTIAKLDLNDAAIINSPYYNLQQNDIIYVQPNKTKARNADVGTVTSLWISITGTLISLASLIVNFTR
ncbi:MAG: polysaccharide biosynthesis/export family protein [Bacteroidaceae bacterium]